MRAGGDRPDRVRFYFRREWKPLALVTVTGLLYNVGLGAGPLFEGKLAQCLLEVLRGQRDWPAMARLAALYVAVTAFVQAARYAKRFYVRRFANNVNRRMKAVLYAGLLRRQRPEMLEESAGSLLTRAISDVDACVEGMRKFTTEVFDTGVVMVAYLAMLLSYDWRLTLLAMLFPPVAYFLAERLKGIVTRNAAASKESGGRLNAATLERITNGLTYRVYGQEAAQNAAYEAHLTDYEKKAVMANVWENAMQPVYQVISMLGTVMIIWFGGKNVLGTGWTVWNVAAFSSFFSCYKKLAVKSSKAAKLFNAVQKARVSWGRIQPYLASVPEEAEQPLLPPAPLAVCGLSFAYPGQKPLFTDVTFQAEPGQIVGVTGEVACGKSTLGRLFTGELPFQGRIALGNAVFPSGGGHWGNQVGYLGHQPELFSGTVEENICLGKPGDIAPVLRAVCMDREVAELPDGPRTRIGSGGVRLSGGQQARIALARTLYHKRPVMVLDDPFSAVDMETEAQIYENLRQWGRDSVILLISHRLALFPKLDQVLWMEHGTVRVSTHDGLMEREERYRMLYESQRKGAEANAE